ncbi:hypothetical protein D9M68_366280 [compost metagenome]
MARRSSTVLAADAKMLPLPLGEGWGEGRTLYPWRIRSPRKSRKQAIREASAVLR